MRKLGCLFGVLLCVDCCCLIAMADASQIAPPAVSATAQSAAKPRWQDAPIIGDLFGLLSEVPTPTSETYSRLRKPALDGDADAQYQLAIYSYRVADNKPLMLEWLQKAAAQNHAKARIALGNCYSRGIGVPKDLAKASLLYKGAQSDTEFRAWQRENRLLGLVPRFEDIQPLSAQQPPGDIAVTGTWDPSAKPIADQNVADRMRNTMAYYRQFGISIDEAYEYEPQINEALYGKGTDSTTAWKLNRNKMAGAGQPEEEGMTDVLPFVLIAVIAPLALYCLVLFFHRFPAWFFRAGTTPDIVNRQQRICLWAGIVLFVLMGLFPPRVGPRRLGPRYTFLVTRTDRSIDMAHLAVQWILVAVVTGGLMLTFRRKEAGKPEARQDETHQPPQDETHTQFTENK
jgi:hypothetical protein